MGFRLFLALASLSAVSAGCGTLFRPLVSDRTFQVTSEPEGADVFLDGLSVGTTPCAITLTHASRGQLSFRLDGHETREVTLEKRPYWPSFLGIALIGFYPWVVVEIHDREREHDASWRDDLLQGAGITLGAVAALALIDAATGSNQYFPPGTGPVRVTLRKRPP